MTSKILRADGTTELTRIKSVVYTESVNAGDGLRPGCVASASIEVEVFGAQSSAPASGESLTYYQVDQNGNETLIGTFYAEPSIPTRNTYKFVAYDAVSKLDKPFSDRLTAIQNDFPMTIYDIVTEACNYAGVTLASVSWALSTQTVNAFYADGLTCRNILQYAAEIAGRFVRCKSNGQIIFDWYAINETNSIHPGSTQTGYIAYKQDGLTYDNYSVLSVDAVAIRPANTEGAAYIYPSTFADVVATDPNGDGNVILTNLTVTDDGNGNLYLSVGATDTNNDGNVTITQSASASNTLIIGNNLLLTDATETFYMAVAQNLYNVMSALPTYRHAEVRLFTGENPFRAGQFVSVTDIQGVSFVTPVFDMKVSAEAATLRSSGKETYDSESGSGNVQKELKNLSSNLVRLDKLKVNWADIQEAIIQYLKLYGLMTVYEDDVAAAIGGHIGYGSGPSDIGNGIALISREPTDTWEEAPILEGSSVILIGEKGLFFGLHYWGPEIPIWIDGGIDVNQNNYRQWFKLLPSGLLTNCPITAGSNITDGNGNVLSTVAESVGDTSDLDTTDKSSTVNAINELAAKFPVSIADGGTGATDAAGARTNLGIVAGESASASGTITLANRTVSNVCSITLPSAGTYILIGFAEFASDANGVRTLSINSSTSLSSVLGRTVNGNAVDGYPTRLNISTPPITISAAQTWYLNVWQNSGSPFDVSGNISYVRLA